MKLRLYQEHGINNIRAQFVRGLKRICFVAPCGAGKTLIMAYMASRASEKGKRTMFLVHRRELIEQAAVTFKSLSLKFGIIAPNYPMNNQLIQIGSVQTVARRLDKIPAQDLIILDECHHATAKTWLNIIDNFDKAKVVGLTATPARLSGEGLGSVFDSLIIGAETKDLIEQKYLAPYKYYAPPVTACLDKIKTVHGDYDRTEINLRMNKPAIIGDAIEHYKQLASNTQAIAYCTSIQHSINTAAMFNVAGISAVHIDSKTSMSERKLAMENFRNKKIKILCNCDLFGEGIDVPSMQTVVLLRPTKSLTLYIQQAMRGMRIDRANPDKQAIILDHVGNVFRHGLPDSSREWSLEGTKKTSRNKQASTVSIKVCSNCFSAHDPANICPYCGFIYPIESNTIKQKAGELKELSKLEIKGRKIEVGRAKSLEELKQIADERGYKSGWIYMQAKLKGIL